MAERNLNKHPTNLTQICKAEAESWIILIYQVEITWSFHIHPGTITFLFFECQNTISLLTLGRKTWLIITPLYLITGKTYCILISSFLVHLVVSNFWLLQIKLVKILILILTHLWFSYDKWINANQNKRTFLRHLRQCAYILPNCFPKILL